MKKTKHNAPADSTSIPNAVANEERIRQRAHEIYQASGGTAGNELDHWLQAESELKACKNPPAAI